jgi:hypothetical protein
MRSVLFGGAQGEIIDISAGGWRGQLYAASDEWAPIHPSLERRKYLLRGKRRSIVAKFVGLGPYGRHVFEHARALHAHGFIPAPLAYRDGFLLSTWHEGAVPGDAARISSEQWIPRIADYLACLSRCKRRVLAGAAPENLFSMARRNITEGLGADIGATFADLCGRWIRSMQIAWSPIVNDGRMHRWEWIRLPSGRLLKTDALDHHCDHGLAGCQDLAWDLAAVRIEHALNDCEYEHLRAMVARKGQYRPHRRKETFAMLCYLAYQLAYYTLAERATEGEDRARCSRRRAMYADAIATRLNAARP